MYPHPYIYDAPFRRDRIFYNIKSAYACKKKKNIPVYGIKSKELREFCTTKKDLMKGI
jgi:hypothetical protein